MLSNPNPQTTEQRGNYLENPNVPLSEGATDIWGSTRRTNAGIRVSPQMLLKVAALWQGVSMISGDVAKIPLEIYRRANQNTDRAVLNTHPAYRIVRRRPNRKQSAYEFRRQMILHALIWGNAYAIIERNGRGEVTGLLPLLPDRTCCRNTSFRNDFKERLIYQSEIGGKMEYFDEHDILHVKGISFDGECGLELFAYARDTIGKILARENFSSKFFKHGGRVGGTLQLKNVKDKQARDRKEADFRRLYEDPDAAFKTVVLREYAQFHAAQASFRDTQLVEVEQNDVRTIARLLNMPPHKLGAQGTTSYSSLEQENQAYYDNCLSHWLTEIECECYIKLFSESEQSADEIYFEHTVGALLWADSKTVSSIGTNGVRGGWLRPNEVRKWFNLPRDPDGDKLYVPSGMVIQDDEEPDPDDDPDDNPDVDDGADMDPQSEETNE